MSPETKRKVIITAGTLIPIGSLGAIVGVVWWAAGINKTVEAHSRKIEEAVLIHQTHALRDEKVIDEIRESLATIKTDIAVIKARVK